MLDQTSPLAEHVVSTVGRIGQRVGQHVQQHRKSVRERRSADQQPLRVDTGIEVTADQREFGVDLLPRPPTGAEQQGGREQLGPGAVQGRPATEGHPQSHLDQGRTRLADGDHGQPVVQGGGGGAR